MITGTLLRVPSAQGLFHRAVLMSGTPRNVLSLPDAEELGKRICESIDVWTASASQLMRKAALMARVNALGAMPFQPFCDGKFVLEEPCSKNVDILMGVTDEEFLLFIPKIPFRKFTTAREEDVSDMLKRMLGPQTIDCHMSQAEFQETVRLLGLEGATVSTRQAARRLGSCLVFEAPMLLAADQLMHSNRLFLYRNMLGASHAGELGFAFGTWNNNRVIRYICGLPAIQHTEESTNAGQAMEKLWMGILFAFMKSGHPAKDWPRFGEHDQRTAVALNASGTMLIPAACPLSTHLARITARAKRPHGLRLAVDLKQSRL